ncbi:MAG: GAF domain-containing protein, partial [Longimicrobiales bacterium]
MDLRLVIHRGLTFAFATIASLLPVGVLLALLWPRIASELEFGELLTLVAAIVSATLLVPPTKDLVGGFLDKYVYRTETNFRLTVRQASRRLTRFLDLTTLLSLISDSVTPALRCEGVAIYLKNVHDLELVRAESGHRASRHRVPKLMSALVVNELTHSKDAVVADEVARSRDTDAQPHLHDELTRLNWALVLPLLSEDSVIGAIVVGPKLSGDPFYPH